MNSRQAYDEEETLRRVIEESKGENEPVTGTRRGKRSRDESEECVSAPLNQDHELTVPIG